MISQAHRYLGCFCSSQRIFLPQIIQVLLSIVLLKTHYSRDSRLYFGHKMVYHQPQ